MLLGGIKTIKQTKHLTFNFFLGTVYVRLCHLCMIIIVITSQLVYTGFDYPDLSSSSQTCQKVKLRSTFSR